MELTSGEVITLDEEERLKFGLALTPDALEVYSSDESLAGAIFQIEIQNTLVEERTWYNTTLFEVVYVA